MKRVRQKTVLDRSAAAELWRNTLAQIPSLFGRLVYLASLRDQNTGRYEHHGLAQLFGEDVADEALRESHAATFHDWLCYTLEQQKTDLDLYLAGLDTDKRTLLDTWIRLAPYRTLVPASARDVERKLYLADLETLLELLKNEYDVAAPDPDA
ncbi:MAG TPA: hypothetical protein VNJ11_08310 [Bryobacteraceae bacterium]|nr:hypothetical protein [Bryobacteraceae bacterium]